MKGVSILMNMEKTNTTFDQPTYFRNVRCWKNNSLIFNQ